MPTLARTTALATLTILLGFFFVPAHAHAATKVVFLTSGTSWTVPSDWNNSDNPNWTSPDEW